MDRLLPTYVRVSAHRQKPVSAILCPTKFQFPYISIWTRHKSLTRPWHSIACLNAVPGTCSLSRLSLPLPLLPEMSLLVRPHRSRCLLPGSPCLLLVSQSPAATGVVPSVHGLTLGSGCRGMPVCAWRITLTAHYCRCTVILITATRRWKYLRSAIHPVPF